MPDLVYRCSEPPVRPSQSWRGSSRWAEPLITAGIMNFERGYRREMEVEMKISECMSHDVRVAAPDNTMQSAAQVMADIDAGFLPVADHDRLIGIVTDRDIAVRGVAAGRPPETSIREVMSNEVQYCFDDQESEDVLGNMSDIQVRRLPVVDRDKRLVGIVSITDLASNGDTARAGETLSDIARPSAQHSQTL